MPENNNTYGELDSVTMPLDGITMIEAAAGTGKTYNIQNIVARLIVEKNFPIETLAVVTFTDKATKELAGRLRKMLELLTGVLNKCSTASEKDQERAQKLLESFTRQGITYSIQKKRLEEALHNIDDCRVSTIHGFCSKLLAEYAFESSMAFQVKLEKNVQSITEKLIKDFCRSTRYSAVDLPGWEELDPGNLVQTVNDLMGRHSARLLLMREPFESKEAIYNRLHELQQEFIDLPDKEKTLTALQDKLVSIKSKSGNDYLAFLKERLSDSLPAMESHWKIWQDFFQNFRSGTFAGKGSSAKQNGGAANKEFVNIFTAGERLFAIAEDYCMILENDCRVFLQTQAVKFVTENLRKLKHDGNFHDYNDLLIEADNALKDEFFRRFIQKKFNAGIIDEFQDTDPLQYSIFKAIFADRQDPRLIMVGDPRQAIYAFRGGDIVTYLTARQECIANNGRIYTLTTNYRSSGEMIDSFNTLFAHSDPFFTKDIVFEHVEKPEKPHPGIRFDSETVKQPLSAAYIEECNSEQIYELCAEEISRMLSSDKFEIPNEDEATKKEKPFLKITPGDIAVLAYSHSALDSIRKALARYNIPAIGERKGGIWNSAEAAELESFMQAVLENTNTALVRRALLSRICGADLTELNVESPDGREKMLQWQLQFIELADCWQNRGTASLITNMLKAFSLKARLTVLTGGERILSNYIQLGDLLAAAELSGKLSPQGVLK
ncbi:MAG: UvrD-helicase domain-containing protein, partial [Lentisphaeria bacterium]|nr:UvrD-helicase domain-containing protein [Lentisphaeria bacterium]